jgi:hypothetical protein
MSAVAKAGPLSFLLNPACSIRGREQIERFDIDQILAIMEDGRR